MLTELDKVIREKGVKKTYIAYVLGITVQTFSKKLHGKSYFMIDEALKILDILGIPKTGANIQRYFFAQKVERKCRECAQG